MALFIRQNEERSELQQRLAAELQAKAKARAQSESVPPDGVDDSKYIEGTKQTTGLAWAWVAIFLVALALFVIYVVTQ
jgi:hypothetical protein